MRIGRNPAKFKEAACTPPERVTLASVIWVPELTGYFEGVLEVFRLSLLSARENTTAPFDVLVLDNNSCDEVNEFLQQERHDGNVQYHIRCDRNFGTVNATVQALRASPGELVVYADCDVFFRPQWLETLIAVQEAFPEAGMICGVPIRHAKEEQLVLSRSVFSAVPGTVIEEGDFVPRSTLEDWAHSIGLSLEEYSSRPSVRSFDLRLSRGGVTAYAGGGHFAYLTTAPVINRSTHPRTDKLVPARAPGFDVQITGFGLPTIATPEPVFFHLGNYLGEDWVQREYRRLVGHRPPRSACQPSLEQPVRRIARLRRASRPATGS